jgi:hypothetical protein
MVVKPLAASLLTGLVDGMRWWRRQTERTPGCTPDRVPAIHARLAALELERLELLADEGVPGRKHRLDALAGASEDLRAELARLEPGPSGRADVSPPTPCRTAADPP